MSHGAGTIPRWQREADRLRHDAPGWLDLERLPWWCWLLGGLAFGGRGAYLLLSPDSPWDVLGGIGLLVLVTPAQLLMARRRRRGEPVLTPLRRGPARP